MDQEISKLSLKYQLRDKKSRVKFLTRVSMFTALSYVFYITLKFPLPFFPSFLEINFSMIFILIGSLSTGPLGAAIICVVRFLLKLPLTHTFIVGEVCDLIIALIVSVPTGFIYLKHHDKKGGFIALAISFVLWVISSVLCNVLITIPMYLTVKEDFINRMSMVNGVNENNYLAVYTFACCLPFNLLIAFINCGAAIITYKKISMFIKRIGF